MPQLRTRRIGLIAALACLVAPGAASARDVVTAENMIAPGTEGIIDSSAIAGRLPSIPDPSSGPPEAYLAAAQTFTARASGTLRRIDVIVAPGTGTDADLRVSLMRVDDAGVPVGFPPGDEVAGANEPIGEFWEDDRSVDFADGPRLVAGRRYAVGLSTTSFDGYWWWRFAGPYAGGQGFWRFVDQSWRALAELDDFEQFAFRVVVDAGYDFAGFRPPLAGGDAVTTVKAGRAVPVKFSLGGVGTATLSSVTSRPVACAGATAGEPVAGEAPADGPRGLVYDAAGDEYSYVWKTEAAWAGTCREFALTLDDGVARTAVLRFVR